MDFKKLSWYLSSISYKQTYVSVAHQVDSDFLDFIGGRVENAFVADCGCGPGVVTKKLAEHGATKITAIDMNPGMIFHAKRLLKPEIDQGKVRVLLKGYSPSLFKELKDTETNGGGFDIVLFKRSLYCSRDVIVENLKAAYKTLRPDGQIIIIHPNKSFLDYVFKRFPVPALYSPYHFFNRIISLAAHWLRVGEYRVYSNEQWYQIFRYVSPKIHFEEIPTKQRAYLMYALKK